MVDFQMLAGLSFMVIVLMVIIAFWTIVWKGFGLWIAAREGKKWWFIAILILSTFGILEILFIFAFSDTGKKYLAERKLKRSTQANQSATGTTNNSSTENSSEEIVEAEVVNESSSTQEQHSTDTK